MLDGPRDAACEVDLRSNRFAGLANLVHVGFPTRVYRCAGRSHSSAQHISQLFDITEVFRLARPRHRILFFNVYPPCYHNQSVKIPLALALNYKNANYVPRYIIFGKQKKGNSTGVEFPSHISTIYTIGIYKINENFSNSTSIFPAIL